MTLLSLDQSSYITGYAVFIGDKLFTSEKFVTDSNDIGTRLHQIRNKIKELIEQFNPDHVIYEDIQQQQNVENNIQTFKTLAQVQGVIIELLTEVQIPYSSALANQWKSKLKIKGKTRKEQKKNTQLYVKNKYNLDVPEDIADAIGIGEFYIQENRCAW